MSKIKRKISASDDVHAHLAKMTRKKTNNNLKPTVGPSALTAGNNYFAPLQTIDDDIEEEHIIAETKQHIPPITILKAKIQEIHELCLCAGIKDYSIRKLSIGLKVFCESKNSFDLLCKTLDNKYDFFTYAAKDDKPYKALLFGLESQEPLTLKNKLIAFGLNCIDVKIVHKKTQYAHYVIYVVYFQRKSVTIKELRQKYNVIDYVKVKWDFQTSRKNRITQCYNCQMFGHGSNRCKVKTFCSNCAGNHQTKDCTETVIRCANCSGAHKSTDENCPSKSQYLKVKQKNIPLNKRHMHPTYSHNANNFPNTLRQSNPIRPSVWPPQRESNNMYSNNNNANGELFTIPELQSLTMDLINNLRNCKTKLDQFEVITNLACKFLS